MRELKEAFEGMEKDGKGKGSLKPDRRTRQQAREAVEIGDTTDADNAQGEQEGNQSLIMAWSDPADIFPPEAVSLDPRAFAEPVDIIPKVSPSLQTALKSAKWKERKEALDDLLTLLSSTPRIKDAPELGELAKSLASRIAGDANISCVMVATACIEDLAKGMMTAFAKYREVVMPLMLERMKERKASVTDSIGSALDAVFATVSIFFLPNVFGIIFTTGQYRVSYRMSFQTLKPR